jgi:hypothetical protein
VTGDKKDKGMFTQQIDAEPIGRWSMEGRFIINHEFRYIYCPIPKNASSSLKALCLLLEKEHDYEKVLQPNWLHSYANQHLTLSRYSRAEAQAFLNDPRYFKFCIVRNPWSRLVSAYLDKFLQTPTLPWIAKEIDNIYRYNGREPNCQKSISFRQFVEYLAAAHGQAPNIHWRPQYHFLGAVQFHFMARFETLAEDFQVIKQVAKLPVDLPWRNQTAHKQAFAQAQDWADLYPAELRGCATLPPYQKFYTPDLVEIVRQRYQTDIELFGYEFAA